MPVLLILIAGLFLSTHAAAQAPCPRPVPPPCTAATGPAADPVALSACHREVNEYVVQMVSYLRCLTQEYGAADQEMKHTVNMFNCKLAGRDNCN